MDQAPEALYIRTASTTPDAVTDIKTSRRAQIISLLQPHLPYSLPIYNRYNFHLQTEHARYLTSFDLTHPPDPNTCFAVAYLDRSRRSETECWIYLSSENPKLNHLQSVQNCAKCKAAALNIISQIAASPLPPSVHAGQSQANLSLSGLEAHAQNEDILLAGTLHSTVADIIVESRLEKTEFPGRKDQYTKYLFDIERLSTDESLASNLRWSTVREQDFDLVRSRTSIPRTNATLRLLPSIAIFESDHGSREDQGEVRDEHPDKAPIAWAFLGVDSSLTSLHVEPGYRGQGLAKKMVAKIYRDNMKERSGPAPSQNEHFVKEDSKQYGHADVSVSNAESNGVCRSLGGWSTWSVYWLRIDLAKVRGRERGAGL